jgi:hypothetical protein
MKKMIHDISRPEISDDFTIDDIHKIRQWNYERLRDATREERKEDMRHRLAIAEMHAEEARVARQEEVLI